MRKTKIAIILLFLLFIMLLLTGVGANAEGVYSSRNRQAILNVNAQFERAWAQGDAHGVAALYTEDGLFMPPGAPPLVIEGRSAIADAIAGVIGSGIDRILLETEELEIYRSRRTAYELGVFSLIANGQVVDCGPYMVLWKREKGHWRLARDIFNSSQSAEFRCQE